MAYVVPGSPLYAAAEVDPLAGAAEEPVGQKAIANIKPATKIAAYRMVILR
jgi:hypothetical protein